MLRHLLKRTVVVLCMVLLLPAALLSGFGRWEAVYTIFAHACALLPGLIGDYFRIAYYVLTLRACSMDARVRFGSYLPHTRATLRAGVDIGAYCIIGSADIGERTKIASHVQILSGQQQHYRDAEGRLADESILEEVHIGSDCWIGSGAIIMADLGNACNVGAGSVVGAPVAPNSVVMGNPARTVRSQGALAKV